MKRIIALSAAVIWVLLSLTACEKADADAPITVNSTAVDEGVFCYYLDEAFGDPACTDKTSRIDYATNRCIRYVAVNTAFLSRGLSLSPAQRAAVSEETNALWRIFGGHYEKVGVFKETLYKLRTSMAYTEGLRTALFDTGGTMPVAESALQSYFAGSYFAVRYLQGYLYTTDVYGNTVNYTDEALSALLQRFNDAAQQVNAGVSLDAVYASLTAYGDQDVTQHLTTVIVKNGDPAFPQTFYTALSQTPTGKAAVCVADQYVYLLQSSNILSDLSWFREYRPACLKAVSEPSLENEIIALCGAYTSVRNRTAVNRCYAAVSKGRGR